MGVLRHWLVADNGETRVVWDGKVADDFKRNGYAVFGPYLCDGPSTNPGAVWHKDGPLGQIETMAQWVETLPTEHVETRGKIVANLRAAATTLRGAVSDEPVELRCGMCGGGGEEPDGKAACQWCDGTGTVMAYLDHQRGAVDHE